MPVKRIADAVYAATAETILKRAEVMIETDAPGFTTKHEIRFIENIGLNKFGCLRVMESRRELIVKYIKALGKRADWAGMDKDIVLSTAKKLLREV